MYTGLIETTGKINNIIKQKEGSIFIIEISFDDNDVKTGDSININGVCLTVVSFEKRLYRFYCSYKTLELTNLGFLTEGDKVNVERSLTLSNRLGGHLVSGHIDDMGKIIFVKKQNEVFVYKIELPSILSKYVVKKGSISIDGISLTVVEIKENMIELILIPETINKTNIVSNWLLNHFVNIEVDMIARYTEKLLLHGEKT